MSLTATLGSLAVATKGQYMTGVSVDIGTSFVKPAGKVGDVLTVKAIVTGIGECSYSHSPVSSVYLSTGSLFRQISGLHPGRFLQCPGSAGSIWPSVTVPLCHRLSLTPVLSLRRSHQVCWEVRWT